MKKANILLGIAPLFALAVILCSSSELTPVRIVCAVIAAILFITYIVLFIKNKKNSNNSK